MIFSDTGFVQQNAYYIFYLPLKLNSANKLALPVFDVCQSTKKKHGNWRYSNESAGIKKQMRRRQNHQTFCLIPIIYSWLFST